MDEVQSRAERRGRTRRRSWIVGIAGVAALLIAGAVALLASGGGNDGSTPSSTTVAPSDKVALALGTVAADSAGPAVNVTPEQSQQVLTVLTAYVKGASVEPLRSGKPATADFSAVFDPGTLARV